MFPGFALVISVDCNSLDGSSMLAQGVKADGDDIDSLLRDPGVCGYKPDRITRLDAADATRSNVTDALNEIAGKAGPDDPVFVFFSGHGAQQDPVDPTRSCLALSGFDPASGEGVFGADVFESSWAAVKSNKKLFMVDACFAGGLALPKAPVVSNGPVLNQSVIEALAAGGGTVAIASSRDDQTSNLMGSDRNSLFTKHLLEGLKGAAGHDAQGYIRVFDLFTYVTEMVRQDCPSQIPVYSAHQQEDNFPVTYCQNQALRKTRQFVGPTATSLQDIASISGIFANLYPVGPSDRNVWERAGGDISHLRLGGTGRADWYGAIKNVLLGGGGAGITLQALLREALFDYPKHQQLVSLSAL